MVPEPKKFWMCKIKERPFVAEIDNAINPSVSRIKNPIQLPEPTRLSEKKETQSARIAKTVSKEIVSHIHLDHKKSATKEEGTSSPPVTPGTSPNNSLKNINLLDSESARGSMRSETPVNDELDETEESGPRWDHDNSTTKCLSCNISFTMTRRRHHCRNCGHIFCGTCTSKRKALPHWNILRKVRVCESCFIGNSAVQAGLTPSNSVTFSNSNSNV